MLTGILLFLAVVALGVCFMACATATRKSHIVTARITMVLFVLLLSGGIYSFLH